MVGLSKNTRQGTVMLEFVLAFPVVLVLILACIQIAHIWMARLVVHYAAYCAARAALVTVCDAGSHAADNDSWPLSTELPYRGLQPQFCQNGSIGQGRNGYARTEAEWAACRAAAQVCAWIVLGNAATEAQEMIPGWGEISGSGAAARKTRAIISNDNWNVQATVEHDFALIVPLVGPIMAWGLDPWDADNQWAMLNSRDITMNVHNGIDSVAYPHVRLTETVWLSKPYHTVIAAGNWSTAGRW